MGIRFFCVDPNAQAHNRRWLIDANQRAACGELVDVDGETACGLLEQPSVWQLHEDDAAALGQVLAELADMAAPADVVDDAAPVPTDLLADVAGDEQHEEIQ